MWRICWSITYANYPFRSLPITSEPLWPPKPKLFDIATEIARCRAWFGV